MHQPKHLHTPRIPLLPSSLAPIARSNREVVGANIVEPRRASVTTDSRVLERVDDTACLPPTCRTCFSDVDIFNINHQRLVTWNPSTSHVPKQSHPLLRPGGGNRLLQRQRGHSSTNMHLTAGRRKSRDDGYRKRDSFCASEVSCHVGGFKATNT